jgi:hypothetical protein
MLNQILNKVDFIKGLPFIANKGYDSISVIQKILDIGLIPAIKTKQTLRVRIKHPLRQLSKENWLKYGKKRYRIESLFGNIKIIFRRIFLIFGTGSIYHFGLRITNKGYLIFSHNKILAVVSYIKILIKCL